MPNNYILLETIALTQSAASVTFDNLPTSGYTDLKVVASARSDRADTSDNIIISFNASTANLSYRYLQSNGASAYSSSGSTGYVGSQDASTATASTFGNAEYYIPNYRSANFKSVSSDSVDETNATNAYATLTAQLWSNTAAITSINLKPQVGSNFVANSTFSLYGVAALGTTPVLAPKATGGNIVANDGTYWYHAFTSSGNFVPQVGLTCDYLVVAGGGGGSSDRGGGGGAGGLRSTVTATGGGGALESALSLISGTNYTVTIGAGGAGGAVQNLGVSGSNSTFSSITSTGGGRGGNWNNPGVAGGSGGGGAGSASTPPAKVGGSGTANQGRDGGSGVDVTEPTNYAASGGGGGASAVGATATVSGGGNGGAGVTISALATPTNTGVSGVYAGGGGGGIDSGNPNNAGAGGAGGGGAGGKTAIATAGIANTGGGGGGGGFNRPSVSWAGGAAGGSGVVIIRYPIA